MHLPEFLAMWQQDGTRLIEEDRRAGLEGTTWLLYSVEEPTMTIDYGRHYGLIVVLNTAGVIIAHNIKNISSANATPWRKQVWAWYEEHYKEPFADEQGRPILVGGR